MVVEGRMSLASVWQEYEKLLYHTEDRKRIDILASRACVFLDTLVILYIVPVHRLLYVLRAST